MCRCAVQRLFSRQAGAALTVDPSPCTPHSEQLKMRELLVGLLACRAIPSADKPAVQPLVQASVMVHGEPSSC